MLLNKMKLRQKLTLLLLLIGLLPTLVVSIISYITISTQLTNKTVDQLNSIAVKQGQKIDALLQSKQEETLILANRYDLQSSITAYQMGATGSVAGIDSVFVSAKGNDSNIQDIYLTSLKGRIIASSTDGEQGETIPTSNYQVANGQENSVNILKDPADGTDKLYIVTREIINQQNVGYLTLVYGLDDFIATTQDYTGLGNSGETVVATVGAGNHTVSLFPLRFNPNAALTTNLDSLHLTQHLGSTYSHVTDYRDQEVTVSSQSIGFANWVVATIIDNNEAFASIAQLRTTIIGIVLASSLAIALVALYFTRYLTAPIIALTQKTRSIILGDLNQKIAVTSSDEVGILAKAFNDMTESLQSSRRRLGEEHARLQASINSLNLGYLMVAKDGSIVSYNPALTRLLGFVEGSSNLSLDQIQHRITNLDLAKATKACLDTGEPFSADNANYGNRFLSISGVPIRLAHGEIIGSVIIVEDITEAKNLARSRDEFFSIASHELRTPLTAIKGNSNMILEFYKDLLINNQELREMVEDMESSSVRLIDIVNDFLDVSKLEQGKMPYKNTRFDIAKVIESVVYETGVVSKQKGIYLKFDHKTLGSLPQVWADPDKTKQVVYNLIGNASKFTEKGGITIDVVPSQDFIKVIVTDTGRGIAPEGQLLLFHKFQQTGESLLTRDTTRGTGLGLYISKLFVEGMGGEVKLEHSKLGEGSAFSFTLPLANENNASQSNKVTHIDTNTGLTTEG
jgi:two-component system sensor histidine kinase ResE